MKIGESEGHRKKMKTFEPSQPVVIISTHLDDAVLSCAQLIHATSNVTVITVLAGAPDAFHEGYNSRTTGEPFAPNAMKIRRDEDAKAMAMLSAQYVWLDFLDNDYLEAPHSSEEQQEIRDEISNVFKERRPQTVLSPLGLSHPDHIAVSDACLELAAQSDYEWYFYLDMPYALAMPELLPERLRAIEKTLELSALEPYSNNPGIKREVMKLYESQFEPTRRSHRRGFRATMKASEQYWKVTGGASSPNAS
jgi:LmbE family N-acetylglucosaminyl deacetylase